MIDMTCPGCGLVTPTEELECGCLCCDSCGWTVVAISGCSLALEDELSLQKREDPKPPDA